MDQTLPTATVTAPTKPRFALLDTARGLGILLVVYGHFLQSFFQATAPLIYQQYHFIYAFHMPLFFILSGMVGQLGATTLRKTIRGGLELVALVFVMHLLGTGIDLLTRVQAPGWSTPEIFRNGFVSGNTSVGVMWFLLCLGLVRLTVGSALLIRTVGLRIAAVTALLALFAWHYANRGDWPHWQNTTLLFASIFFLIGRYLPLAIFAQFAKPCWLLLTIPATLALAFLNTGCGFAFDRADDTARCGGAVFDGLHPIIMMMGEYNNYLLFIAGGIAGTLMCLALAALLARNEAINTMLSNIGRQTLGLLLLNALYCAFLLPLVQAHMPTNGLDSLTLTATALGLTLLQVLVFYALKPATDVLIAVANWISRSLVPVPSKS